MSLVMAGEGGISLNRTRIIYHSTDNAQTLTIQNQGSRPYLVQSAVVMSGEGHEIAPFITMPPLFRLEKNRQNALRILRKGGAVMSPDRESVFYFIAIAIPGTAQPKEADTDLMTAHVSVGIQNTVKLFYRPAGLTMAAEEAEGRLTFDYLAGKVLVTNPTPYYLTLSSLIFDGMEVKGRETVPMISPFSQARYTAVGPVHKAQWTVINDYGGNSRLYSSTVSNKGGGA